MEGDRSTPKGYYEFPQDENLLVLSDKDGQKMPILSEKVLELLEAARSNVNYQHGWSIFPWYTKIALMQNDLLRMVLAARRAEESLKSMDINPASDKAKCLIYAKSKEPYVWQAIDFVDRWVYDIYPFNRPDEF